MKVRNPFKRHKQEKPQAASASATVQETTRFEENVNVYIRRCDPSTRFSPIKWYGEWYLHDRVHNIKTNAGVNFFQAQCYAGNSGGSVGTNGTNFMCLSNDATAPAFTDTVVAGELTTNGLGRVQATVVTGSAASGTATTTVTNTFTGATAQTTGVQKGGILTASSGGTLGHEYTFTSTTINVGDQLQIQVSVAVS